MLAIIFFIVIPLVLFFYFKYNIGSIIVILFLLFIFYYTPYSYYLEPTYWQFRNMCKLNELPNNEEKYNKILSYFDKKLGDRDDFPHTKEYSERIKTLELYVFYHQYFKEHDDTTLEGERAIADMALTSPKEKYRLDFDKIRAMSVWPTWHTKRYYPDGNEGSGFYWSEMRLDCVDVVKYNTKIF